MIATSIYSKTGWGCAGRVLPAQLGLTSVLWLLWSVLDRYSGRDALLLTGILLAVGIPHGANDLALLRQRYPTLATGRACALYVALALAASGLMAGFPELGLLLFLGFSAYHFGQGDLHSYVRLTRSRTADWLYLSWGGLLLTSLLGLHASALAGYLPRTDGLMYLIGRLEQLPGTVGIYTSLAAGLLLVAVGGGYLRPADALQRLLVTVFLFTLFARTSLLFSFSVYFGIWHSAEAIGLFGERLYRSGPVSRLRQFYAHALPLTVLAGVLLGVLVYAGRQVEASYSLLFWVLTFLFGLTVPHVLVSAPVYRHTNLGSGVS